MFELNGRRGFVYFLPAGTGAFKKRFFNFAFGNDAAGGKAVEADGCIRSHDGIVREREGGEGAELLG